jgi:hypothetical protein
MTSGRDYCNFPHCSDEFCNIDVRVCILTSNMYMRLSNYSFKSERLRFSMVEFGDSRVSLFPIGAAMMSVTLMINLRAGQVRHLEIRMRSLFFIAKYYGLT